MLESQDSCKIFPINVYQPRQKRLQKWREAGKKLPEMHFWRYKMLEKDKNDKMEFGLTVTSTDFNSSGSTDKICV